MLTTLPTPLHRSFVRSFWLRSATKRRWNTRGSRRGNDRRGRSPFSPPSSSPAIAISIVRCHRVQTDAYEGKANVNGKSEWTCSRGERIRITRRRVSPFALPYFRGAGRDEATEFRVGSTMVLYRYTHDCMFTNCLISSTNRYRVHFSCPRAASPLRVGRVETSTPTFRRAESRRQHRRSKRPTWKSFVRVGRADSKHRTSGAASAATRGTP